LQQLGLPGMLGLRSARLLPAQPARHGILPQGHLGPLGLPLSDRSAG